MVLYECTNCNFSTLIKCHYIRHSRTNKHLDTLNLSIDKNVCKYCNKEFKHMQSMYRHIKYTCKQNKDEDVKELVRLMNLRLEQKDKELELHKKQIDTQEKQIEKLMGKLQINIHGNVIQNIQLLPYKETDYSHLTEKDYVGAIKRVNFCVRHIIEKIHFNPSKPENMNIYISNLKDKYMMMYEGGNWNIKNKTELDNLYDDKEMLLEDWLDKEQHKYPELKEKFERYINNKEKDDTLNMIKDDIKMMLYNKKCLIEN
uniref:Uncharacterized protein n=1 Tax=viral metagenome TaxID=1070528 RepID=A0A6C0EV55_9ZZZZ